MNQSILHTMVVHITQPGLTVFCDTG